MKEFLEKIRKNVETYGQLIDYSGSYYVCKEILKEWKDKRKRTPASLAEFMINLKEIWEDEK